MKKVDLNRLERIDELLKELKEHTAQTYQEIHELMDALRTSARWDDEDEEEVDADLLTHMDEIFGEDE